MKKKTLMGTLLTDFRAKRYEIITKSANEIWKKNKLDNPTKRGGYELHESQIHGTDGSLIIVTQLWKKLDETRVKISANIEAGEVEATKEVADLLK
jgi:hypothetical protein